MPRPTRKCVLVFYFHRFQFILHLNIYIKYGKICHAHVAIFTGQPMLKKIENVLKTPWPRQPIRIWLDPPQTTLKANQTLNFTNNLSINRNWKVMKCWYSLVNQCSKNMQKIETVINTPVPHQTMRIWPDPPQSTLNANSILHFTPVLPKHSKYLSPDERRRSTMGVE